MPVKTCQSDGKPGFKWGDAGKCYTYTAGNDASRKRAKEKAIRQGLAIEPGAFKGALELSAANLERTRRLFMLAEAVRRAKLPPAALTRQAYYARLRLERRWLEMFGDLIDDLFAQLDLDGAISLAVRDWKRGSRLSRLFLKADGDVETAPSVDDVTSKLASGVNESSFVEGAVQTYLGMARAVSEEAGQMGLDSLGLNRTFAWAHPRAMPRDLFAVRGSKVIQNVYGSHLNELSKIVIDATNPRFPQTTAQVKREIRERWPELKRYQVDRVARTETAAVWTSTSMNAYRANGVTQFESLLAHGPTIGIESALPCPICVDMSAQGAMSIGGDLPPWHPSCRCEAVPILDDWLPPDEPWTGQDLPMCGDAFTASRKVHLPKGTRLSKAGTADACLVPASPLPSAPLEEQDASKSLAAQQEKWASSLTSADRNYIEAYQRDYQEINGFARSGLGPAADARNYGRVTTLDFIIHGREGLREAAPAIAEPVVLYRGVARQAGKSTSEIFEGAKSWNDVVGKTVTDTAFISTSTYRAQARGFASLGGKAKVEAEYPVVLKIEAGPGTKGVWMNGALPENPVQYENEFLLARGTQIRVTGVELDHAKKIANVTAEVVP